MLEEEIEHRLVLCSGHFQEVMNTECILLSLKDFRIIRLSMQRHTLDIVMVEIHIFDFNMFHTDD